MASVIIGFPSPTETRIPMATVLLTPLSLASISRGSPETKLSSSETTLTTRIRTASALARRSLTTLHTVRTAGTTLLQASAAKVLVPKASLRR